MAFVDKLSEDPVLTQKIAENINSHLFKHHDVVVSHTISSASSTVPHTVTVTSVSSVAVTASVELAATPSVSTMSTEAVSTRNKSTTSTADLSINEDSLMSALEVHRYISIRTIIIVFTSLLLCCCF